MSSPPTLDIAQLLAALPGENPAGQSIRYDGTYDALREARRADDPHVSQGEWVHDVKVADWRAVIAQATEALSAKSKDLQVAAWLLEALVRRHGFAGLRDGLHLLWELQERFWPCLYPEIEDGDLEARALSLEWVNQNLPRAVKEVPIAQSRDGKPYSWSHWEESRQVDNLSRQDQEAMAAALADGKITGEEFDKAVEATPLEYYQGLSDDLDESWDTYERFVQVVDEKLGRDAPSLAGLRGALEDCRRLVSDISKKKGGFVSASTSVLEVSQAQAAESYQRPSVGAALPPQSSLNQFERIEYNGQPSGLTLEPQNRADALRRLEAVAAYFHRTEPHSPVSYLVQRAVRWGEMPLEAWLQEVINDDSVLSRVRDTLGLKDADNISE